MAARSTLSGRRTELHWMTARAGEGAAGARGGWWCGEWQRHEWSPWRRRGTPPRHGRPQPSQPSTCSCSGRVATCSLWWRRAVASLHLPKASSGAKQSRELAVRVQLIHQRGRVAHTPLSWPVLVSLRQCRHVLLVLLQKSL